MLFIKKLMNGFLIRNCSKILKSLGVKKIVDESEKVHEFKDTTQK